jgi:GDP-mannose 4,6 dehydratase
MRKPVLMMGITGQAGSYLANLLLAKANEVHCLKGRSSSFNIDRIDYLYVDPHTGAPPLLLHYCDITGVTSIIRKMQEIQPEEIYNLAARSRCRGNHHGVERVACPRSATRTRADEQPGGGPPAKCLRPRGDDLPGLRLYLCRPGYARLETMSGRRRIRGGVSVSNRKSNGKSQWL